MFGIPVVPHPLNRQVAYDAKEKEDRKEDHEDFFALTGVRISSGFAVIRRKTSVNHKQVANYEEDGCGST